MSPSRFISLASKHHNYCSGPEPTHCMANFLSFWEINAAVWCWPRATTSQAFWLRDSCQLEPSVWRCIDIRGDKTNPWWPWWENLTVLIIGYIWYIYHSYGGYVPTYGGSCHGMPWIYLALTPTAPHACVFAFSKAAAVLDLDKTGMPKIGYPQCRFNMFECLIVSVCPPKLTILGYPLYFWTMQHVVQATVRPCFEMKPLSYQQFPLAMFRAKPLIETGYPLLDLPWCHGYPWLRAGRCFACFCKIIATS